MNWRNIVVPISLGTLLIIISVAATVSNTVTAHAELPQRVEDVENRQSSLEKGLSRLEGKVDTVITMLRGGRK